MPRIGSDWAAYLQATPEGLSAEGARQRLLSGTPSLRKPVWGSRALTLLLAQFQSPIILILLFAVALSFFLREATDALLILSIVLVSGLLGFWQEWRATDAVDKLLALVQIEAMVPRDGQPIEVPVEQVVPGDVVILNAGDVIPGDGRILESKDLFVTEAALTGETFPVEKSAGHCHPKPRWLGVRTVSSWGQVSSAAPPGSWSSASGCRPSLAGSRKRFVFGPPKRNSSMASAALATCSSRSRSCWSWSSLPSMSPWPDRCSTLFSSLWQLPSG